MPIRLPIVPRHGDRTDAQCPVAGCLPLPRDYMSDFSWMGLVVGSYDDARQVLESRFKLAPGPVGMEVEVEDTARLAEVVRALTEKGIDCTVGDIVEQVYQG
jgi:hypothetical protein